MSFSGGSSYMKGEVNEATYHYWLNINKYRFQPTYDESHKIIGYKTQYIIWLYPNIDWQDVYQHVTRNGKSKEKVETMWDFYFICGVDHGHSLHQEFEVAKFYMNQYIECLNSQELTQEQQEQLTSQIDIIKGLILDADGKPSFDAYVQTIQNSIINSK
jgi:hypothetical protein